MVTNFGIYFSTNKTILGGSIYLGGHLRRERWILTGLCWMTWKGGTQRKKLKPRGSFTLYGHC